MQPPSISDVSTIIVYFKYMSDILVIILCRFPQLQWRNWLAHGTYMTVHGLCRGCEFEPHLEQLT